MPDVKTSQTLWWDAVPSADSYQLELSDAEAAVIRLLSVDQPASGHPEIAVATLCEGQPVNIMYGLRGRVVNAFGTSDWTDRLDFKLINTDPIVTFRLR